MTRICKADTFPADRRDAAGIPAKAVRGVIYVIFGLLGGAGCVVILIWAGKYVVYLVRFAKADW